MIPIARRSGLTTFRKAIPRVLVLQRQRLTNASFPAHFVRGGTSNGLVIDRAVLPQDEKRWQPILSSAMGSPDEYGRQLNGIGSGVSSTSKICVISPSQQPGIDIDFTFVQVGIKDGSLDMAGNCGNMSAAVGPIAWNLGMWSQAKGEDGQVTARILNTNTNKVINATFAIDPETGKYQPLGDYAIDGVPGKASQIIMSFLNPAGAKTGRAFPTGNKIDRIFLESGESVEATLSDIANPGVFIRAQDVGIDANITPEEIGTNLDLMSKLDEIRRGGTQMMGLDPDIQSVPKIVMVQAPSKEQSDAGVNIVCRALSMQQPHKAVPLTLGMNLGAISFMSGTIAHQAAVNIEGKSSVVIQHASGKVEIGSEMKDGEIVSAKLHRTARVLMKGEVFYTVDEKDDQEQH